LASTVVAQIPATQQPAYYSVLQQPSSIDYTSKDWIGFVTSMLNYAAVIFPQWDTSSEADFGVMLVELFAYMGDILSFYGDRLSQEAYLPTATQLSSVYNIAQLLGYTPSNGSAATGTVTFQTINPGQAITLPAGFQVSTSFNTTTDSPVIYQTDTAVTVPENGGTATVNVTQGITYTTVNLGTSTGLAAQSFSIPQTGVEDGSVSVYVSSSSGATQWTQVNYLIEYGPDDTVYSVYTNSLGITQVNFGDNINGLIPGVGLVIYATYTIGLGSAGNQPAGSVGILAIDIPGVYVPFTSDTSTLFQSSAMTGGADAETIDQIRANAPQSYATQNRAITLPDFEALSLNVQGVTAVSAVANHSTSVTLYALGPNYLALDTGLQANLLNYLSTRTLAGTTVTIGDPTIVPVDVGSTENNITLQVLNNYNQLVVQQNVILALQAVLSPPNTTFGDLINVSDLYAAIMSVPGVAYVVIPLFTREDVVQSNTDPIQFRPSEIPVAGDLFITSSGGIA
jgi:Baseplate J-like protein